jgi:diaminopimelate decarboxylase
MERVAELIRGLRADGHQIKYVDAGGGLGIAYRDENLPELGDQAKAYADALTAPLKNLDLHLLLEPGRSIVAPAGVLLTRVLYRKTNNGKKFLIVDAAMNDLIRPSLYQAYHEIVPVAATSTDIETTDVVGPVCETGDFFARDRELPIVDEGALLALLDAGAYGLVLSSNYNTRPRPAEVLIDGTKFQVIRRRETVADLLRAEKR